MSLYKNLFRFTKSEIDYSFKRASLHKKIYGLKLLLVQHTEAPQELFSSSTGKLLIIIPKACGKAHVRNKIRRRLKSLFYEKRLYTSQRIWILLVYPAAANASFEELSSFMTQSME
jgi:ribonuclease P protein component